MKRPLFQRGWLLLLSPALAFAAPPAPAVPTDAKAAKTMPACKAPAGPGYLLASQADMVVLLPPPPADSATEEQQDLQAVLEAQRTAHADGRIDHAVGDANASCGRFADVLGPALTAKSNAKVLAFLDRAARDGASLVGPVKSYWKRTRPYAISDRVERLADMAPDWKPPPDTGTDTAPAGTAAASVGCLPSDSSAGPAAAADTADGQGRKQYGQGTNRSSTIETARSQRKTEQEAAQKTKAAQEELAHSSYPSGHSTFGTVCAILLADMVPEKRAQLFARGRDFGHSRLVVGAHFPSDVEEGRIAGTVAATLMMQNAKFQHDYVEARVSLRSALGLSADPPAGPAASGQP